MMKGNAIVGRFRLLTVVLGLISCEVLFAQSYIGYIKPAGVGEPSDSLLVTITVPEGQNFVNTVYVRDTVYVDKRGTPIVRKNRSRVYYDSPWMFGFKTNLLSDAALALPYAGLELQIGRHMSLDLSGWYGNWNMYFPYDHTRIYGGSPEIRWWIGDKVMREGHFVGIHGNAAWFTMKWKDEDGTVRLFQNGSEVLEDIGNMTPAWSCGLTYGYSLGLGRNDFWGLEFFLGLGYSSCQQKIISLDAENLGKYTHSRDTYIGITKVGINLTYRFSLRRVKFGYYAN
ncbi:MAG: DUF3575 domain-containing protein [Bacteroidales bacterium]|nr:DUF3575 domain-containing protein [Bacteroidales bacterium]